MPIIIRPNGDTDLANANITAETTLPQTIGGLTAGDYQVGRLEWAPSSVTVSAPAGASAIRAANSDVHYTGPGIPANVSGITLELDWRINDDGNGFDEIMEYTGGAFRFQVDTRVSQGGARMTMEDSTGTLLLANDSSPAGIIPQSVRHKLVVTATQDRGDGNAEYKIFVDDVEQFTNSVPASGTGVFEEVAGLQLFLTADLPEIELYEVKIFHAYFYDGNTSNGTAVHAVAGAASNWNTPNDTGSAGNLVKAGVGSFT